MQLALLSDIHGNIRALEACLAHAHARGANRFAVLGDLVGYGADPSAVVARVQALQAAGAVVLKGNHDAMAVAPPEQVRTHGEQTARWTHTRLDAAQREWLDALPLSVTLDTLFLVHASALAPELWHYVYDARHAMVSLAAARSSAPQIQFVFNGHVHEQTLYYQGLDGNLLPFAPQPGVAIPVPPERLWLATVGSVGQPRDGRPDAMYALLDSVNWTLTFHRVAYHFHGAANDVRLAGLPEYLAARLERGR